MSDEAKNLGDAVVDRKADLAFTPFPWSLGQTAENKRAVFGSDGSVAIAEIIGFPLRKEGQSKANETLIVNAPHLYTFLMKIYLDYEHDCNCECNSETCCAVVGEPCAKCHANVALLLVDQPISDETQPSQASEN